jgi:phosphatidylglycerol:prolipoprotein diacylglycerol transferase
MLVHPQFDPVAFSIGPIAVRWYGLMYLLGFVLFVVLGRMRARRSFLTGWRASDVDDMLFYGVFGVILGGRLGYVLFYKPLYYAAHPLEIFAVWQGGMSFHGGSSVCSSRSGCSRACGASAGSRSPISWHLCARSGSPPGGSATSSTASSSGASRTCPGRWCFRRSTTCRVTRRSFTSSRSKASRLFVILWMYASARDPRRRVGPVPRRVRHVPLHRGVHREPDSFLGYFADGLFTMGQLLSLPMIVIGFAMMSWAYRRAAKPEPTVIDRMK